MTESPWIVTTFERNRLVPASAADLEVLAERYRPGTQLRTQFSQPRSLRHHNLYWGVLRRVVEMTGATTWSNAEALNNAVKAQLGMYGPAIIMFNGDVRFELQSTAFSKMDQGAFKIFFEQAMSAIGETTLIDMAEVIDDVKHNIGWTQDDENRFNGRRG
jgi:hypothetical protein